MKKEYNNYYYREDIAFNGLDPLRNYDLQRMIDDSNKFYPNDINKQREYVMSECSSFWNETNGYEENRIDLSNYTHVIVKSFYYQNRRWFYWWDMYVNGQLFKTGLEFFPTAGHICSYLIFATSNDQSPLMMGKEFIKLRKE